jgi:hypothetical protein
LTAFIDGSQIYGADEKTSSVLRSFSDGKLKENLGDQGSLMPFATVKKCPMAAESNKDKEETREPHKASTLSSIDGR